MDNAFGLKKTHFHYIMFSNQYWQAEDGADRTEGRKIIVPDD